MANLPDQTAARVIEIALGEVGVIEEPVNRTKYGKHTMADGLPWCGSFIMWVFNKANLKVPNCVSTPVGAQKFKDQGRWSETPERGYIAFMDFPHDGVDRISHVGVVIDVKKDSVITVEGNTSGTGDQRNGGMVLIKERSTGKGSPIVGYGIPRFAAYSGEFPKYDAPDSAAPAKPKKAKNKDGKDKSSVSKLGA